MTGSDWGLFCAFLVCMLRALLVAGGAVCVQLFHCYLIFCCRSAMILRHLYETQPVGEPSDWCEAYQAVAGAHVVGAVVVMSEGMARLRRGIAVMQCTRRRPGGSVWVGKHYEWTAPTPMHLLVGINMPPDILM